MNKINAGVWAGIVILLISLVILFQSFEHPYSSELGPGPGFFPVWLSGILLVLSLFYMNESINGENAGREPMPKGESLKKILFILTSLIIFVILLPFVGFILAGTIFLFILLFRHYKWYTNVSISFGISLFLFWLFGSVLSVSLPVNGFGW